MSHCPVIAITPGEPAGIGPDLVASLANQFPDNHLPPAQFIVVADPELLHDRARIMGMEINLPAWMPGNSQPGFYCLPVKLIKAAQAGSLDPVNSAYVIETLRIAAQGCLDGKFQAMVTGPVHKGAINAAGIPFTGHTEFLEQQAQVKQVVMMLATEKLKVALVTTHLPLKAVPEQITRSRLKNVIEVLHHDMQKYFNLPRPRIAVCGLNPHAGESGHMGTEEIEVIEPVLAQLGQQGFRLTGPLSADTVFNENSLSEYDVILAMYHDQGLPVIKHAGFSQTINITLGLPFIRTSVDHGTALDLAGTKNIDPSSMYLATRMAITMAQKQ